MCARMYLALLFEYFMPYFALMRRLFFHEFHPQPTQVRHVIKLGTILLAALFQTLN